MSLAVYQDRWEKLDGLFKEALDLPPQERKAFCTTAAGDDVGFGEFLFELVSSAQSGDDELKESIFELAQDVSRSALLTGERADRWLIGELIAKGGMGEVYLATRADGEFEKSVIVKVLHKRFNQDDFIRHFKTERSVHAALRHPYIPALVDAGQLKDGRPFLVAEYVDGLPIDEYCDKHASSRHERIELVEKVCHAIAHAHSNLVLHLDIKPNNILVDEDGMPSLLDFGISRLIGESESGHDAFTPEYASPEQLAGQSPSTVSDVYALGGLVFCLLEGRGPFEAAPRFAPRETKLAAREALARDIRKEIVSKNTDREISAIIRKAMAEAPNERYASVTALAQDLNDYRKGLPISALPKTLRYRVRKYVRRNAVAVSVAAVTVAMILAFAVRESQLRSATQRAYEVSEQEAETARQIAGFLIDLFESSDPRQARGEDITARDLLARGAARIDQSVAASDPIKIRLLQTMGSVHTELGMFEEAEPMFVKALALDENAQPPDPLRLADTHSRIGDMLREMDRFDEADVHMSEALAIRRRALPADAEPIFHAFKELGLLRMEQGRYEEAETLLEQAEAYYEKIDNRNEEMAFRYAIVTQNLASVYVEQDRLAKAEAYFERTLGMLRARFGEDHPSAVNVLIGLTMVHREMGHYDESEKVLLDALRLSRKTFGDDHARVSIIYNDLGSTQHDLGNFRQAIEYYDKSIDIERRAGRAEGIGIARTINNLAWAYLDMEDFARAEPLFHTSLELRETLYGPDHPNVARAKYNLATLFIYTGNYTEAEALVRDDMRIKQETMPEERRLVERSWHRLGQIAHRQGRMSEAAEFYAKSLQAYERRDMGTHPRVAYLLYDRALLRLDTGDPTTAAQDLRRALKIQSERLPAEHPHRARTIALLGEAELRLGAVEESRAKLSQGLQGMRGALVDSAPSIQRALSVK